MFRPMEVKGMKHIFIVMTFLLLSVFPSTILDAADNITASGCSVSNLGYLSDLAAEYEKRTGKKVFVRGGGSLVGLDDLQQGKVDFAASCRPKAHDDPEEIEFIQVAWDALVFIVHKTNPVSDISIPNVKAIYYGEITNWKQLNGKDLPIKLLIARTKKGLNGVWSSVNEMLLKEKKYVDLPHAIHLASPAVTEQMVEETPGGFATTGFTSGRKRDVKMLKVNGVTPTKQNIVNGRYPMKRPLFLVIPKDPKPEVKAFIDFTLSKSGQQFIDSLGVVSLTSIK